MKQLQTDAASAIGEASDGQLFALMTERGESGTEAWAIFYSRYVEDLHKLVYRVNGLAPADVKDLVQETMKQAYRAAHTFQARDDLDAGSSRGRTLLWLLSIARRLFLSKVRKEKVVLVSVNAGREGEKNVSDAPVEKRKAALSKLHHEIRGAEDRVAGVALDDDGDNASGEHELLQTALATLPAREREVLLTYYRHFDPTMTQQRLPDDVIAGLKEKYGVGADNLRQIRVRAQRKVEQYLEANAQKEGKS